MPPAIPPKKLPPSISADLEARQLVLLWFSNPKYNSESELLEPKVPLITVTFTFAFAEVSLVCKQTSAWPVMVSFELSLLFARS